MLRVDSWPYLLWKAVEDARDKPFVWGRHDCVLFAADCILAITEIDIAGSYRGTWRDGLSALRAARELVASRTVPIKHADPLETVVDIVAADHELCEVGLSWIGRGDLVMARSALPRIGVALGISLGAKTVFASENGGISFIPIDDCFRGWRV